MSLFRQTIAVYGLLTLLACSKEGAQQQAEALQPTQAQKPHVAQLVEVAEPRPLTVAEQPIEVDVAGRRVRMPGQDWISVAAFWDIYLNRPTELIGTPDHAVLAQIPQIEGESMDLAEDDVIAAERAEPMTMTDTPAEEMTAVSLPEAAAFPARPEVFTDSAPGLVSTE